MSKRIPQTRLQRLGDILQTTLKKRKIILDIEDQKLQDIWNRAVGPQIACQTRPDRIRRNTLYVRVSSSVWIHQLQFLKEQIIEKINRLQEKEPVKNIYFSIGDVYRAPSRGRQNPLPLASISLTEKDKKLIEKSAAAISDKELQKIVQRVMAKGIYRRRTIEKLKGL